MQKFYDKAYDWLITVGPRVVIALLILFIGFWLIRKFIAVVKRTLIHKRVDPSLRPFLTGVLSLALQVLLVFAVMQVAGIQLTIFAALIGAFGVAAGLALSGTLQNFTGGILILVLKPFRVGDNIIAQSIEGTVTGIRLFYTVVTTFDNRTVIFPNSKLSNEIITNLSREGKRRMDIELKFAFTEPFEKIKAILEESLQKDLELLKEPVTRIGIVSIAEDGYKVMVNAWSRAHGHKDTLMKVQEGIVEAIQKAGIKMAEL